MEIKEIIELLEMPHENERYLFERSTHIKSKNIGNTVYLRGLIELSNICMKDCHYCGIRSGAKEVSRYNLTDEEVVLAARYAWENRYGSISIQSGEVVGDTSTARIE